MNAVFPHMPFDKPVEIKVTTQRWRKRHLSVPLSSSRAISVPTMEAAARCEGGRGRKISSSRPTGNAFRLKQLTRACATLNSIMSQMGCVVKGGSIQMS